MAGYCMAAIQKINTEQAAFANFERFWDQDPSLRIFYFPTLRAPDRFRWDKGKGNIERSYINNLSSLLVL